MPARSDLPLDYDADFIAQRAGLTNHYGWEKKSQYIEFVYPVDTYNAVQDQISNFKVNYLDVMLPRKINEIVALRQKKVLDFTFAGTPIYLDLQTQANLVGCTLGLERNTAVDHIDWHQGDGVFITLSRDFIFAIADAAFLHIQMCFSRQRELTVDAQAAPDIDALAAIDINQGWPPDFGLQ